MTLFPTCGGFFFFGKKAELAQNPNFAAWWGEPQPKRILLKYTVWTSECSYGESRESHHLTHREDAWKRALRASHSPPLLHKTFRERVCTKVHVKNHKQANGWGVEPTTTTTTKERRRRERVVRESEYTPIGPLRRVWSLTCKRGREQANERNASHDAEDWKKKQARERSWSRRHGFEQTRESNTKNKKTEEVVKEAAAEAEEEETMLGNQNTIYMRIWAQKTTTTSLLHLILLLRRRREKEAKCAIIETERGSRRSA